MVLESMESGNYFLYLRPLDTIQDMFANHVASAFATDLLVLVVFFFLWSYRESKNLKMQSPIWVWLYTMIFGLAGGLPLFLYLRESHLEKAH